MKKSLFYLVMLLFGAGVFISCNKKDDPPVIDNPVYGMQISGTATNGEVFSIGVDQIIEPGSDFTIKEKRSGMYYGIYYLSIGKISFKNVLPASETSYGITSVGDSTQSAEAGSPFTYTRGKLVVGEIGELDITSAGLYYIITDEATLSFWLMKIDNFEISATGDLATLTEGSATTAKYKATAVDIRAKFKIRMNTAWKIVASDVVYTGTAVTVDDHVRMVTSYGGTIANLTPDGDDISVENNGKLLDFTFTWNPAKKGIAGIVITTVEGNELPALEYPENLYMIGSSVGGWDWEANGIEMVPVNGNAHLFWRIVWLEPGIADPGIKFSPEKAWGKDFGVEGDATNGVYAKGTANVPEVATAGYYTVVVNLKAETIEVNPATVYGIGDVFGSWDVKKAEYLFTLDTPNKLLVSPAAMSSGNLRMYVSAVTFTNLDGNTLENDWWRAEFNIITGNIVYRGNGGDLQDVAIAVGQMAKLNFLAGTGTIE